MGGDQAFDQSFAQLADDASVAAITSALRANAKLGF
jgi:hypothetical protein